MRKRDDHDIATAADSHAAIDRGNAEALFPQFADRSDKETP
jgi:hypothetical protein